MRAGLSILISTLMVIAWLAGPIVLIVLGLRGKPRWSSPSCAKCRYDLRARQADETPTCPECGADLTSPKGVLFARPSRLHRSWGLVVFAISLILAPLLVAGASYLMVRSNVRVAMAGAAPLGTPASLRNASVDEVVDSLAKGAGEPWGWNELVTRTRDGNATAAHVDAAVGHLIAYIKAERAANKSVHLSWQREFLNVATQKQLISSEKLLELARISFGPPTVNKINRVQSGTKFVYFQLRGNNQNQLGDLVTRMGLKSAQMAGQPVEVTDLRGGSHYLQARFAPPSAAGSHEMTLDIVFGLFHRNDVVGLGDQASVDDWPPPIVMWTDQVTTTFDVLEKGQIVVGTTTDPRLDPQTAGGTPAIAISNTVAVRAGEKVKLTVQFEVKPNTLKVVVSGDVVFVINGETYTAGGIGYQRTPNVIRSTGGLRGDATLPALDPSIQSIQVVIKPNPKYVNTWPDVAESWGQDIVFDNVPLRRLDLAQPVAVE